MITGCLALCVLFLVFSAYFVGYWQAQEDAKRESKAAERKKFDTIRAMNYTKRGR